MLIPNTWQCNTFLSWWQAQEKVDSFALWLNWCCLWHQLTQPNIELCYTQNSFTLSLWMERGCGFNNQGCSDPIGGLGSTLQSPWQSLLPFTTHQRDFKPLLYCLWVWQQHTVVPFRERTKYYHHCPDLCINFFASDPGCTPQQHAKLFVKKTWKLEEKCWEISTHVGGVEFWQERSICFFWWSRYCTVGIVCPLQIW